MAGHYLPFSSVPYVCQPFYFSLSPCAKIEISSSQSKKRNQIAKAISNDNLTLKKKKWKLKSILFFSVEIVRFEKKKEKLSK